MRKPIIVLLALTLILLGCGGGRQAALGEAFDIPFPSGGERVSVKGTGLSIGVEDMTESLPTQESSGGGWATTLKISLNGAEQPRQVKQGGTTTVGDYDIKVLEVEPKHVSLRVTRHQLKDVLPRGEYVNLVKNLADERQRRARWTQL